MAFFKSEIIQREKNIINKGTKKLIFPLPDLKSFMIKNKKKILRIFIAGHKGMVGSSLVKFLKKKKFGNLILASRKELNLEDSYKVEKFIKFKKPNVIINCAGRVAVYLLIQPILQNF